MTRPFGWTQSMPMHSAIGLGSIKKMGRRDQAIRDYKKVYDLGIRPDWLVEKLRKFGALP